MTKAISRARGILSAYERDSVSKTIWGSPAGKKRLANRLAAMLPPHRTYVEPFAGSAAVLFAKERSDVEVINDADPDIVQAYRIIQRLGKQGIERLRQMKWVGDENTFKQLIATKPKGDVAKLHRFLYLTHFSYGKMRGKSFSPSTQGIEAKTVSRIEAFGPRLKDVKIHGGDYERVIKQFDGPDTVFFLDPPYAGYDVDVGESKFDEDRFFEVLKSIKGKFLLTYGVRGKLPGLLKGSGFHIQRIRSQRSIRAMRGVGGSSLLTQLVVTNYAPQRKGVSFDGEHLDDESGDSVDSVEKTQPFGTFGGSHHYAKRIVPLIPAHKIYVEPFAGAAAVLHAKEPSEKEVIADIDPDVVFLHRMIKGMTEEKLNRLRRFNWTCTETSWKRVRSMTPRDDIERFYKLAFIRGKGRDARPDATHPAGAALGQTTNPEKYLRASERLKEVTILHQDYKKTISQLDGSDTFFFLDPPYPGEWFDKDGVIELDEFIDALKRIKGSFIAVLNDSPENVAAFKKVGHIFRLKVREASGTGGAKRASRLFCANFKVRKADTVDVEEYGDAEKAQWSRSYINDLPDSAFLYVEPGGKKDEEGKTVPRSLRHFPVRDHRGDLDIAHLRNAIARIPQSKIPSLTADDLRALQDKARKLLAQAKQPSTKTLVPTGEQNTGAGQPERGSAGFTKPARLIKGADPTDERYVLGVVLEPEVVDAQGDIYSAEEIRRAAHLFMEDFGGLGVMHRFRVNGDVKVLESYLAPVDFEMDKEPIRRGTWLLAVRVLSDELWEQIKDGALAGFSIGGTARRYPERGAMPSGEAGDSDKKAACIGKAASPDSGKTNISTNRLLDIVVEEVSLVDRAANKRRFLIVKRSNDMDGNNSTDDVASAVNNDAADGQGTDTGRAEGDDVSVDSTASQSTPLAVAMEALENLTDAVEAIAGLDGDDAEVDLDALATQLQAISERLAGASRNVDTENGPPGEQATNQDPSKESLSAVLSTVRDALQGISRLLEQTAPKPSGETTKADGTKPKKEKEADGAEETAKGSGDIAAAVRALVEAVKGQQKRLARMEKRFGLPNSLPAGEGGTKPSPKDDSWPLDLNNPMDRESVDKAVSFHEV